MPLIDTSHPVYRPLWLRLLITLGCLGWAGFELLGGHTGWALFFGAIGAYAGWVFFVTWDPGAAADEDDIR
ncbi:hypothetical protein DZD18_00015 [Rhodobacteraceae bacterium W635]|uniref:hypothetical protein n=1 Tax=Nioella halotolerans TaxID=2303578 RepID=UPI000E3EB9A8|nr:hypothetical protein DZD18_00015 [Rhodobacteraceae bacterium W635]